MGGSSGDWLSHDATGFEDGPNVYAYVRQNPWSKFDPLGLAEADPPNLMEFFDGSRTLKDVKGNPVFARDNELEQNVRAIALRPENSKRLIVGMHANADEAVDSNTGKRMGEISISKKIKDHPFYGKAESILFASCNSGNTQARKDPLAARVADRVDKEIEAPSRYGSIGKNGVESFPGSGEGAALGQGVVLDYSHEGTMNIFDTNGKLKGTRTTPAHPEWNKTKNVQQEKKPSFWQKVKNVFRGKKSNP